jgi:hypothetical protein
MLHGSCSAVPCSVSFTNCSDNEVGGTSNVRYSNTN